jgi:predicted transcriptional regulator
MQNLNPTLWRTCRMLTGKTRIKLLRHLHENPGRNVSDLAKALGIGVSGASQELRRIQSRGLLQVDYRGANLVYRFGADPQVASAAPLLKAIQTTLSANAPDRDEQIHAIAQGLGHRKRIELVQALMKSPKNKYALHQELHTAYPTIGHHLQFLLASGLVRHDGRVFHYVPPVHPLAKALVKLLPD